MKERSGVCARTVHVIVFVTKVNNLHSSGTGLAPGLEGVGAINEYALCEHAHAGDSSVSLGLTRAASWVES